jgi:hypothetical protein
VLAPASGCEHAVKDKKRFAENALTLPESRHASPRGGFCFNASRFFEIARVLVRLDHVARHIVNVNDVFVYLSLL